MKPEDDRVTTDLRASTGEVRKYKKACECGATTRTTQKFRTREGEGVLVKCAKCGTTISMGLKEGK